MAAARSPSRRATSTGDSGDTFLDGRFDGDPLELSACFQSDHPIDRFDPTDVKAEPPADGRTRRDIRNVDGDGFDLRISTWESGAPSAGPATGEKADPTPAAGPRPVEDLVVERGSHQPPDGTRLARARRSGTFAVGE